MCYHPPGTGICVTFSHLWWGDASARHLSDFPHVRAGPPPSSLHQSRPLPRALPVANLSLLPPLPPGASPLLDQQRITTAGVGGQARRVAGGSVDAKSVAIARRPSSPKLANGRGRMASKIVILQFNEAVGTSVSPCFSTFYRWKTIWRICWSCS
jgi:hypothetical protein